MKKIFSELRSVAVLGLFNGFIPLKNNPMWFAAFSLGPVSYVFLLYVIGRENAVIYAFIGGLIMSMAASAYGLIADLVWYRFNLKLQDMFIATPKSSWTYVLGLAFSAYIWALPSLALFIIIGFILNIIRDLFIVGLISVLTIALWISISLFVFLLSTFLKTEKHVWPLATILGLGLSVFPPVYYPVTIVPGNLRYIALTPPTASSAYIIEYFMNIIDKNLSYLYYSIANLVTQSIVLAYIFKKRNIYQ
ncbi:MAG: hypothetical protein ACP5GI_01370 [Sulfolobales archaeon]